MNSLSADEAVLVESRMKFASQASWSLGRRLQDLCSTQGRSTQQKMDHPDLYCDRVYTGLRDYYPHPNYSNKRRWNHFLFALILNCWGNIPQPYISAVIVSLAKGPLRVDIGSLL